LTGNDVNFVFRAEKLAAKLGTLRLLSEPANAQLKSLLPTILEGRHDLPSYQGKFAFFSF